MEPIDAAYQRFQVVKQNILAYAETVHTESDTRLKVIDRIFIEVLGWEHAEILTEDPSLSGYADYNFRIQDRSRLIVEAKRDGKSFDLQGRSPRRGFKLNGPLFSSGTIKAGIEQAIRYCGVKNAELACVSNGTEWLVFRGNRLGDGKDTTDGYGFIFADLEAIDKDFKIFYELLSAEAARNFSYRAYFQEAEGRPIRSSAFQRSLVQAGSAALMDKSPFAADLDRLMSSFFNRLAGDSDPDFLASCFVETQESDAADRTLARISADLLMRVQELDTSDAKILNELIDRAAQAHRNEFVVIIGTKGAGKTTFITRFFSRVLKPAIAEKCIILRLNLADSPGDISGIVTWLQQALVEEIERAVFSEGYPAYDEIEGMFYDEYQRLRKGPWAHKYSRDKTQFKIDFGELIDEMRRQNPHQYLSGLIRHIVRNRGRLPVIVFDNADHFDISFQESVYQYARSIYESSLCLVILPITDRTSWQLSRQGALQSFEHESLFLPTPPTEVIIKKRIEYLQGRIALEREKPDERYFIQRGISLSIDDLAAFTDSIQRIFLQTADVSRWIGNLANHDVRRALTLARHFATSPHLRIDDLLKAYIANTALAVPRGRATRALIRLRYKNYPQGQHEFVQNVYALGDIGESTPLLPVRVLQLLADAADTEDDERLLDKDEIVDYCQAMAISPSSTIACLDALLKSGLVLDYDPTITEVGHASRIELSPSGEQHIYWSRGNREYLGAMADVTPIRGEAPFEALQDSLRHGPASFLWKMETFVNYLLAEDSVYCRIGNHVRFEGQRSITRGLEHLSLTCKRDIEERERGFSYNQ